MSVPSLATVQQALEAERDTIFDWLTTVLRIPSVTGDEAAAQRAIATICDELGMEVEVFTPGPSLRAHPSFSDDGLPIERPVVVARLPGASSKGRSVIYNGHIDVVPTGDAELYPYGPYNAAVRDNVIFGRGSCDMKGGLIAALASVAAMRRLGIDPPGDVIVQSVPGEETGGVGTLACVERGYRADAAIIFEPTSMKLCPTGAGSASFRLHVPGRAAHGASRHSGVSAIEKFFSLHQALLSYERARHEDFTSPIFPAGVMAAPISIGTIAAGDWPSTVPEALVAEGRAGVFPNESLAEARRDFERVIAEAADADEWLVEHRPIVEWFEGQFEPASTPLDAPLLQHLSSLHDELLGHAPQVEGVPYGSDMRFFTNDSSMPAVLYGPGDVADAHTVHEQLPLEEFWATAAVATRFALTWGLNESSLVH